MSESKRVLLISDFVYPVVGGTERHVFGLAKYLHEKGINVHVLTPGWDNGDSIEIEGIPIHRFRFPFIHNRLIRILRILFYVYYGVMLDRDVRFHVIHSFYMMPALVSAVLLGKLRGKKTILTFFEPEPLEEQGTLKKYLIKKLIAQANRITTLNWTLEKQIKKLFPHQEVTTITNWVEETFKHGKVKKISAENIILFVGRLCEQKGVYVLIKALPIIRESVNCRLVLIGPPWEEKNIMELAKKLGVSEFIEIKGFVSDEELVEWYNRSDLVVYPSLYKGGFGFTLVEAMACGKPVVGSDDVGIPDAIGDAGIVTKAGDEKDLARGIIELLTDEKKYKKCQENALNRVADMFRRDRVLSKYLELYQKVLN